MKNKMNTETMYAAMMPWRLFFVVALPGMVSMFAMSIYSIIEGAFIGQLLGEGAFAAVNIAMPVVMINFSIADLIGVGASVPISIALGKKEHDTANNVFSCSVIMIFLASLFMGTVLYLAAEPLCSMMGADDVLLDTSVRYLRTCALCSPLASIFFAMDNYLRISGYVKTSMVINVVSNFVTLGLLTFFLLGMNMDVVGSALATSLSFCLCSITAMIPFLRGKTLLRFTKPHFHKAMFREIAACGSPVFMNNISGRVTSILLNISLMTLGAQTWGEGGGTTAVAVYAVLMYASDLCWPLLYGISDSLSPAIGFNWGAENYTRVKQIVKCGYLGTGIVGLVSTAVLYFCSGIVASLFVNAEDVMLLEESTRAIRLFCFAYLFRWFGVTTQGFLSAIEKPALATIMSVSIALIFPVLMLIVLWPLGLDGIWLNFVGVNILICILGAFLLARIRREMKQKSAAKTDE
ncbi:MAG: MATE family efflux transporter [Clostridia bacterium]|nr:MATE family efflux transporter [Clostridia bacterium]MBQ8368578.1 MATE family efflux transporter [Clostridia bacterium]MBQ8511993.1 MATE family efflux transporter [Clostridia bacterium]